MELDTVARLWSRTSGCCLTISCSMSCLSPSTLQAHRHFVGRHAEKAAAEQAAADPGAAAVGLRRPVLARMKASTRLVTSQKVTLAADASHLLPWQLLT